MTGPVPRDLFDIPGQKTTIPAMSIPWQPAGTYQDILYHKA